MKSKPGGSAESLDSLGEYFFSEFKMLYYDTLWLRERSGWLERALSKISTLTTLKTFVINSDNNSGCEHKQEWRQNIVLYECEKIHKPSRGTSRCNSKCPIHLVKFVFLLLQYLDSPQILNLIRVGRFRKMALRIFSSSLVGKIIVNRGVVSKGRFGYLYGAF